MKRMTVILLLCLASPSYGGQELSAFSASSDQVLVLYNADWERDMEGSDFGQDSLEIAQYYQAMHADLETDGRPHLFGLSCVHGEKHLNDWFVKEESNDNRNGLTFIGKGPEPEDYRWIRDSRNVEICLDQPEADWESLYIACRTVTGDREEVVYGNGETRSGVDVMVSGIPDVRPSVDYPLVTEGKGRCVRFDATKLFYGTVKIQVSLKGRSGNVISDIEAVYYDKYAFLPSRTGPDGISDERHLWEDVLGPVSRFLSDPSNALPDGRLLKDHILYVVVVHGLPYAAASVFGVDHGVTSHMGNHGNMSSLEQRVQTIFYDWKSLYRPPVVTMYMKGGPGSGAGVVNNIITTAMRNPLGGKRWNPYLHPDAYSFLASGRQPPPRFDQAKPLPEQRALTSPQFFAYGVTRIDGRTVEEAKRIVDFSLYASRYLRPEMDCYNRTGFMKGLALKGFSLESRLKNAEDLELWGFQEIETLGFRTFPTSHTQGLPFMVRPLSDSGDSCESGDTEWKVSGFYPGGMERSVSSGNLLSNSSAAIWDYLRKGVTVTACGSGGGPHITSATFWDNRILMRYLFRGRDLGEALLRSTYYVNWPTSVFGDPLYHPDLSRTVIDKVAPVPAQAEPRLEVTAQGDEYDILLATELNYDPRAPDVALLSTTCEDEKGNTVEGRSEAYGMRPSTNLKGLRKFHRYTCDSKLTDPYGNTTVLKSLPVIFPGPVE